MADLLKKLNLTEEEGEVMDFCDDEDEEVLAPVEWALVGMVLSPVPIHVQQVRSAMKPAWGNPVGLKIRAIGDKSDNMFVAEFGSDRDRESQRGCCEARRGWWASTPSCRRSLMRN